jgi:tripartite-type tricarboxylate transporter receptor subunit TctC
MRDSKMKLGKALYVFLAAGVFGLAPATSGAQGTSPITIIVPFTPGTGIDILARTLGEELRKRWDRPVVVENRPGASGNIGTQAAARAAPDGNTLLMTVNTFVMNASLFKSLPYDPVKSFVPIVEVAIGGVALAVHPSVPAETTQAFVDYAKTRPGQINYGSPGPGTPQHLAMELFKLRAKIDLVHVPYRGSAGAVTDLIGGHISAMFLPIHTVLPLAKEKQVRILAAGGRERAAVAPDVSTLDEQGYSGFDVSLWYGLLAPAGTPAEIIARTNQAINEILQSPDVANTLAQQGLAAVGGPPDRLGQLIVQDLEKWASVARDAGLAQQ